MADNERPQGEVDPSEDTGVDPSEGNVDPSEGDDEVDPSEEPPQA